MRVRVESPDQPEVLALIDELDRYQKPLYPPESHHGIDIARLTRSDALFAVARTDEGTAVGCGAIVLGPEYGEIKRMFVARSARGRGVGKQLLNFLEVCARRKGCRRFVLETGYLQSDALSLYLQSGYVRCGPFGSYTEDPNSVFMHKNAV